MKNILHVPLFLLIVYVFPAHTYQEDDIIARIDQEHIQFIDCIFTDICGSLREISIPSQYLLTALHDGIKFDGSSIPGCASIAQSDMVLKPDYTTFQVTQTSPYTRARILCNINHTFNVPFEGDPRYILQKTMQEMHDLGYEFMVGPELEFFIFEQSPLSPNIPCDTKRYFDAQKNNHLKRFLDTLVQTLRKHGIDIEKIHHEVAHGQYEMSLHYGNALHIADQVILAKHIMHSLAEEYGYKISFMPKPIYGQNGSALHVNFSLWNIHTNQNAFYDETDHSFLSSIAKNFIAGILRYSPEFTALCNPTINSYKRLIPGYEAPIYRCWGKKNRSALIRIPEINEHQSHAIRGEIRSPDAMCNPYLAFACLLKAGIEGISKNQLLEKPVEENLYKLTPEQLDMRHIKPLPTSFASAIRLAQKSNFVIQLLGEQAAVEFFRIKNQEIFEFNTYITDWELKKYI